MNSKDKTVFKALANKLVGYWYHFQDDELLIFSLPDINTSIGVLEIRGKDSYHTQFCLEVQPNHELILQFEKRNYLFSAALKIITADSLILQGVDILYIYERKIKVEFVNLLLQTL